MLKYVTLVAVFASLGGISILELCELGHPRSQALLHLVHGEAILGVNRVQKGVVLLIVVVGLSPFTIRGSIGYDGRLKGAILLEV